MHNHVVFSVALGILLTVQMGKYRQYICITLNNMSNI